VSNLRGIAFGRETARRIIDRVHQAEDTPIDLTGKWVPSDPPQLGLIVPATLTANLLPGSNATATLLLGANRDETGDTITIYDVPTSITSGKQIASGVGVRTYFDGVVGEYVLLTPFACETDQ